MPFPIVPKKSLGIFSAFQDKFARDDAVQAAAVKEQQRLEDRLAAQEMQALEKQTLEERLRTMRSPAPTKPNRTYDSGRGVVVDLDTQTATSLGLPETQGPARNIDPLSEAGIRAAAARAAAVARAVPDKPARPTSQRLLPTSAVEKITGIDNMLSMATEVRNALRGAVEHKTNVTGRVGGVIPTPAWMKNLGTNIGQAAGMVSDEDATRAKDARALIGNLYGTVAKERGGTALSAPEIALLESYIPNGNESETDALLKANRFIKTLEAMRKNKLTNYQRYGYGVDDEAPVGDQMEQIRYSPNNPFVKKTP